MISPTSLEEILASKEDEHLECKEAKQNFHFEKLVKYCAALANENGGRIVLGVTDKVPRSVVGTEAFPDIERTKASLVERLRIRVEVEELRPPEGRVLVFTVPPRPISVPIAVEGAYCMRAGEDLVPMTPDQLRRIFDEAGPDFSAEICPGATLADLDDRAIEAFRARWLGRSKLESIRTSSTEQLLRDAELMTDRGLTYAAIVLFATRPSMGRFLAHAEVCFEYRSSETPGPANQREDFREGFLLFYDRLWELVNLRNDRQSYQDGLFMNEIPTFNEGAVREAVLNAVSHRDYRHPGSVFVRQFPRRIEIVSPGGFPQGITPDNILDRQLPRNRRAADALQRCGLVERAGQGANRIFETSIREGKGLPEFTNTDAWQVSLTLQGQVQDAGFVKFLEKVATETQAKFDTHEFLILDLVHRELLVPPTLQPRLSRMTELGIVERIGRGRGARYLLARRFYEMTAQKGAYTRRKGLDDGANRELLFNHLKESNEGSPLAELQQVVPHLGRRQLQRLLKGLRDAGRARMVGTGRWVRWHAVDRAPDERAKTVYAHEDDERV